MKNNNWISKQLDRAGDMWCKLAHPDPMWPIHGHYQCPKCLRRHAVVWEHEVATAKPAVSAGRIQILPRPIARMRAAA